MEEYLRTGLILRPHGVTGGFKLLPLTHDVNRFAHMKSAFIERNGSYEPVALERVSIGQDAVLVWLKGVSTREEAEALRDHYLCVDRAHAAPLPPGQYFVADLIGCRVTDTNGVELGELTDVLETGANDVYVISGKRGLMVPALKKLLAQVDVENGHIVLDAQVLEEVGLFED